MSVISTQVISVSTLLKNKELSIPHFQRPYKWSVKNVVQLLEDIDRFKFQPSYRIGTIIVHYDDDGNYNIVDGQQRTLTLCLIIKAIYATRDDLSKSLKKEISEIIQHLFDPRFNSEISKQHIRENYLEIKRRVRSMSEDLIKFLLNSCKVTYLVIDGISEAFQFFDSQNSRGKELDPHDLLKAYHLREIQFSLDENHQTDLSILVHTWESLESKELAGLFANFLYRVRGWSKGDSSRHFTKSDVNLFKGINLDKVEDYPYVKMYQIVKLSLEQNTNDKKRIEFPFQLDQTIINGKYFFEMVSHYKNVFDDIKGIPDKLTLEARDILETLNNYEGKERTGDRYVRMLFDCALLYYVDKFGEHNISAAVCKIFIWAYSIRLTYQSLQLASIDNYVIRDVNIFKKIRESIFENELMKIDLPVVQANRSKGTDKIMDLFKKMNYA